MSLSQRLSLFSLVILLLSRICTPAPSSISNNTECIALFKQLPGKVFYPNSTSYISSVSSYFSVAARLTPSCVVTPASTADVAVIVKTLKSTYQRSPRPLLAIRGGGHSLNIAAANMNQGITVDMRAIKAIRVYDDGNITSVGAGALWNDVYTALDMRNLSAVGGRVAGVGVGGLIIGGGLSFFSPEKGFACDNVVNMEVVLASGQVVNANQRSNPDLFTALKGGSNNFGVVTRFDLKSFHQKNLWGGTIAYPGAADAHQLQAFAKFMNPANFDPFAENEQSFLYYGSTNASQSVNNMYYTKPVVDPPALQPFAAIQPQLANSMRLSNMLNFTQEIGSEQPVNQRSIYATTVFRSSTSFLARVHELWKLSAMSVSQVDGIVSVLTFQRLPATVAGNSMGLNTPSSGQQSESVVLCLLAPFWTNEADSRAIIAATKSLIAHIEKESKAKGLYYGFKYLNYAASFQNPIASYGPNAVTKLMAVSRKYDPQGFFQTGVPGGFKLFK